MSRTDREFSQRSEEEQQAFLTQTWCDNCMEADLGMVEPEEYEEEGLAVIEGKCKKCGEVVTTELTDDL